MWRILRVCSSAKTRLFKSLDSRHLVTAHDIETFQTQGVVCLRGAFREWVEKLKKGIATNHANPSNDRGEWIKSEDSQTFYFNDYFNWRRIPEFEEFVRLSPAAEIAGKLMKSEFAVFFHEHVFIKDPGTTRGTPWHQDQPYYPVNGRKNCSLWLPVTPVSKDSCLEYVGGSHKWGKWFIPRKFASSKNYNLIDDSNTSSKQEAFEAIPDIDGEPDKYELFSWDLEPGDCIAFHMLIVHGAKQTTDISGRQVIATRWLGEDATFANRPWETAPSFPLGLKPGDAYYTSDSFPVMWRSGQDSECTDDKTW